MRNFGIIKGGRPGAGALPQSTAVRADMQRGSFDPDRYRLPPDSISADPLADTKDMDRAALAFVIAVFASWILIPLICVGVILRFQ